MVFSSTFSFRLLVVQAVLSGLFCSGFTSPNNVELLNNQLSVSTRAPQTTTAVFMAKKKRRRRKKTPDEAGSVSSSSSSMEEESNELPDFELPEEMEAKPKKKIITNPDEITAAMMGAPGKPARSVNELIQDRALESKFEFDDPGEDALPDLPEIASGAGAAQSDRPRGQLRKSKKYGVAEPEEEENPLKNIPFITDEKGEVNAIKILESGAWLGIFLLIGWEVYINSPLFERAAPMAPVVYNLYM